MKIYDNISQLVGKTPLLRLNNFCKQLDINAEICAKLEYFNPAGSVKDRVALSMLNEAERLGKLTPDSVIIEPTSGNTGIGLAAIGISRGCRVILTMPESMSIERRKLLAAYGAEVILTDKSLGMNGAIAKALELAAEIPNSFLAGQFENPANPAAHYSSTGPEIWEDTNGQIDAFIAGIGTGGSISGIGRYLKEKNPNIRIVGIEPYGSPVLSGGQAGAHGLQGIGAGFIPKTLDTEILDEIFTVCEEDAYKMGRLIARSEGILVGISSGAALWAAAELAKREEYRDKRLVVLLPDGGERYLSTVGYLGEG